MATKATDKQTEKFIPQEIAYRIPGDAKGWKRTTAKTEAAFDRKLVQLAEKGAEIMTRDLDAAKGTL